MFMKLFLAVLIFTAGLIYGHRQNSTSWAALIAKARAAAMRVIAWIAAKWAAWVARRAAAKGPGATRS